MLKKKLASLLAISLAFGSVAAPVYAADTIPQGSALNGQVSVDPEGLAMLDGADQEEAGWHPIHASGEVLLAGGLNTLDTDTVSAVGVSKTTLDTVYALMEKAAENWDGTTNAIEVDITDYAIKTSGAEALLSSFVNLYPQFFFLSGEGAYTSVGTKIGVIGMSIDGSKSYTTRDVTAFKNAAADVLADVEQSWTDAQKVCYVHDYIVTHVQYDNSLTKHNAHDALIGGTAVCQGYALLFQYMMNELGIECDIVSSTSLGHAWNIVKINGAIYHVDCTWDDPQTQFEFNCSHLNLLRSRSGFIETGHTGGDWKDTMGENAYQMNTGTQYDYFFWQDLTSAVPMIGTKCYFGDGANIISYDMSSGQRSNVETHSAQWNVWGSTSFYDTNFVSVAKHGDYLVASAPGSIYKIILTGGRTAIETLSPQQQTEGHIYGMQVDGDLLYYDLYKAPDGERAGQYTVNLKSKIGNTAVTGITLDSASATLDVGDEKNLVATVSPSNATNKGVYWTSSNSAVARVNAQGKITALKPGTATITARTDDGGKTATCTVTVVYHVKGVSLNNATLDLSTGDTANLVATIDPDNATDKSVTWTSSNENVAKVNAVGKVTAQGVGTARITATTTDGGYTAYCMVTVQLKQVAVTSLSIYPGTLTVSVGSTGTITPTVLPANATNPTVDWTSSNNAVATVDGGTVTGVSAGTALITARTQDGSFTDICTVTVEAVHYPVTGLSLNKSSAQIMVDDTENLVATILPVNATNQEVRWYSANPAVAAVNGLGMVTGMSPGTTTITVTSQEGGFAQTCLITVIAKPIPATGISLDKEELRMLTGSTSTLKASVLPSDAANKNVRWESTKPSVATVDANGLVTAVSAGTAAIKATSVDGGYVAVCALLVSDNYIPTAGIALDQTTMELVEGEQGQLTARISPDDATDHIMSWQSSDPMIATVNATGKVTGVKNGTAVITVTSDDGAYAAMCTVTVGPKTYKVTGIALNKAALALEEGGTEDLVATIAPANASNKNVNWTSSDPSVARVNSNGRVVGISAGEATISATTADGGYSAMCTVTVGVRAVRAVGVVLNTNALTIDRGETFKLIPTIVPDNTTDRSCLWSTTDSRIATVDEDGTVTGIAPGTAKITVTTVDGAFTDICDVQVEVPVTGVSIDRETLRLSKGRTWPLQVTVAPEDATNKVISWTSSDPGVATVNSEGVVTTVEAGTATITARTVDGNLTDTCTVTVIIPAGGIALEEEDIIVYKGGTYTLTPILSPMDVTDGMISWASTRPDIASVDGNGKVTGLAGGQTLITATTVSGGYVAECMVTVKVKAEGLTFGKTQMNMMKGQIMDLKPIFTPADATDRGVTWNSSNQNVATVDTKGSVTAVGPGETVITGIAEDGGFTAKCNVSVAVPSIGVVLTRSDIEVMEGDDYQLVATVFPEDTTNKAVNWTSSDPLVATVDETGLVTAVSQGNAQITASAMNGNYTAVCAVTVKARKISVTGVSLSQNVMRLIEGESGMLVATLIPANATNKNMVWTSSSINIASVDIDGKVRAISSGAATVIVSTEDGGFFSTCQVIVDPAPVSVTGLALDKNETVIDVGSTETLKATIMPKNASVKEVIWSSTDPEIVRVDDEGNITGIAPGTAQVNATSAQGGFTDVCTVTVHAPVTAVVLEYNVLDIVEGESRRLTADIEPANASDPTILWSSSDTGIVTVDTFGMITAVSHGSAVVEATSRDSGVSATCTVNVAAKHIDTTGIVLDKTSLVMSEGDVIKINADVSPDEATDKKIIWSSSVPAAAMVDSKGLVTATGVGETTITASTEDGGYTAQCFIKVKRGTHFADGTVRIAKGQKADVSILFPGVNGITKYKSGNNSKLSVKNGRMKARSCGMARVYAYNGSNLVATVKVRVIEPHFSRNGVSLKTGKSMNALSILVGRNKVKPYEWTCSNPGVCNVDPETGEITALSTGKAKVTAHFELCGKHLKRTVKIRVTK